ncbi:MAG TPA: hypothetical protein PKA90_14035 [Ignavibacteria bacterium]|nr:hypothetical protein [Ignavibacteria bacterium]HMR41539.1 hypothetical protein [Ignavibacteria bacterium]
MKDPGKQYPGDDRSDKTGYRRKARLHQSRYRAEVHDVDHSRDKGDDYGNRLSEVDGLRGLNFYDGFSIFDEVKARSRNKYSRKLYSDMLRSEHIPFNMFVPFRHNKDFATNVFNELLGGCIQSVDISNDCRKFIEYAPSPGSKYLNDKTSFDAYIEYDHIDGSRGMIGIEVKYTEHEYGLKPRSKEDIMVNDVNSVYYKVSRLSGIYKPESFHLLKSDLFRQIWRNQILGESILITEKDKYKHFTSMTLFPEGNTHFVETAEKYMDLLANNNNKFIPVTYEKFVSVCDKHCPDDEYRKWIEYLERRYII